jgi:iron complex transport system ATP-binding protein
LTVVTAEAVTWRASGRAIVDAVDLELRAGELVALAGPNGAGKSTLLRLLAGDIAPDSGTIRVGDTPLAGLGPLEQARVRAVMPQHTSLQFAFTVRQVAAMGRFPHRPSERDDAIVGAAMRDADVAPLAERSFLTLSGGEQSLATLARVLAQQAGVLLLDEPTASLDIRHRAHVMSIARRAANDGATVCVVVHDLNLAAAYAHRVALLHEGRKVCDDTPWNALTEERIGDVFDHRVTVTASPVGDHPLVTPHDAEPVYSMSSGAMLRSAVGPGSGASASSTRSRPIFFAL